MDLNLVKELLDYDRSTGIFRWKLKSARNVRVGDIAGCDNGQGYLGIRIEGVQYRAHRLAWFYVYGEWPKGGIDHINGQRADNRIGNLRQATPAQNKQNSRRPMSNNTSGLLGVCKDRNRPGWKAQIKLHGKSYYLGAYATAEDAHAAYLKAKREIHTHCTI